jgi:hypothetical protein
VSLFTGPIDLRQQDGDGRQFQLLQPLIWEIGFEGSGHMVIIPPGRVFDCISSPRALWWIVPPVASRVLRPAWLHDELIFRMRIGRPVSGFERRGAIDREFRIACLACGCWRISAWAYWLAVRVNAVWQREW